MLMKSRVVIAVFVCFGISSYFVVSMLVNSLRRFSKSQNVRETGTNSNNDQNNSNAFTSIKKLALRNETHIELSGTVANVISSPDVNQNAVVMNLNDPFSVKVFLGSDAFRMFVRVYENPPKRYQGKVMFTKDILPLLLKDKRIQAELGLPKDDEDRETLVKLLKFADNSRMDFVQNETVDIPEQLIVRLSIF